MPTSATAIWERALDVLREEIPERTVENWFTKSRVSLQDKEHDETGIEVHVPTKFSRDYLRSNFRADILAALRAVVDGPVTLSILVDPSLEDDRSNSRAAGVRSEDSSEPGPGENEDTDDGSTRRDTIQGPKSQGTSSTEEQRRPEREDSEPESRPPSRSSESVVKDRRRASSAPAKGSEQAEGKGSSPLCSPDAQSSTLRSHTQAGPSTDTQPGSPASSSLESVSDPGSKKEGNFHPSDSPENLRPEFTFSQFIEGDSNRLARSASVAVANHPGETEYNPLVVYGDVGLGKTHLAQAIANHSLASKTAERACYVSSERFTSEFVTAIRNDEFSTFSSFYRGLDLLVVDDIQFIGGKEKTQEEFFHLFNDLHQNGKQIVLCADRPPNQIDGLETRLLSRFQWGLTADIQRPGLEMRVAILQLKAEKYGLPLSQEVFELVAQNITENIRQLEGALKQLAAHSQLTDGSLTAEDASSILGESVSPEKKPRQPSVEDIIHVVSENQSVDPESLIERGRRQDISLARQVAMYFSRKMTDLSYASIGQRFGGRDHSTVIHACRKVEDLIDVEPGFEDDLVSLRSEIRQAAR